MKRYRVLTVDFDTRANVLAMEVKEDWDPKVRAQWLESQAAIREDFAHRYGAIGRLENLLAIGASPFSLIAFHNHFFRQVRDAFIIGSYYPALTASCALGERVLNHLVLKLRDDFSGTPEYKRVYNKDSFDKWDLAINTLTAWGVLLPDAGEQFSQLRDIRNEALHFNPDTEPDARPLALKAISLFQRIITTQFSAFGPQPWYIQNAIGVSFVRRASEELPFVKRVVLPNCKLVGFDHDLRRRPDGGWDVIDETAESGEELSDEDYIKAFVTARAKS